MVGRFARGDDVTLLARRNSRAQVSLDGATSFGWFSAKYLETVAVIRNLLEPGDGSAEQPRIIVDAIDWLARIRTYPVACLATCATVSADGSDVIRIYQIDPCRPVADVPAKRILPDGTTLEFSIDRFSLLADGQNAVFFHSHGGDPRLPSGLFPKPRHPLTDS